MQSPVFLPCAPAAKPLTRRVTRQIFPRKSCSKHNLLRPLYLFGHEWRDGSRSSRSTPRGEDGYDNSSPKIDRSKTSTNVTNKRRAERRKILTTPPRRRDIGSGCRWSGRQWRYLTHDKLCSVSGCKTVRYERRYTPSSSSRRNLQFFIWIFCGADKPCALSVDRP